METMTNNIAIIENSAAVFKSAGEIYLSNQSRSAKAISVGKNILELIDENGMTPELDQRAMTYLTNVSKALTEMKEGREEVTQIMDALKKMYTEVENVLDIKKPGSVPALIQSERNEYAKKCAEERRKKDEEIARKAAKAQEAIDVKAHATTALTAQFNKWLVERKTKMVSFFNGLTLDTFAEGEKRIREAKIKVEFIPAPVDIGFAKHHSVNEIKAMSEEIFAEISSDWASTATAEMELLRDDLIEKLPSKHAELTEQKRLADEAEAQRKAAEEAERKRQEDIAAASAKEKARLEEEAAKARVIEQQKQAELKAKQEAALAEQKQREKEEADRIAAEAQEAQRKAEQEAEIKRQGEQTMALFDKEAELAETVTAPDARQGYEITVLHAAGYVQIFQMWFEREGKNLPLNKVGNTKLDQMKAWCERIAHKTGEKIESKFLKYDSTFKAINKKAQ